MDIFISPLRKIATKILYSTTEWRQDVAAISKRAVSNENMPLSQLYAMQEKKLRELCKTASSGSTYYKRIFRNQNVDPLQITLESLPQLPILERETIRKNFSDIKVRHYPKEDIFNNATGGSSGEPLQFLDTTKSKQISSSLLDRGYQWAGFQPGSKHVKLWGAPTDIQPYSKSIKNRLIAWVDNKECIDAFSLSEDLFEHIYLQLKRNKPALLESYSNILYEFALYLKKNGHPNLNIKAVVSSAGTLYSFQRKVIEQQISYNLFNRYGSREFGNIAHECAAHGEMHIYMDRFIVEIHNPDRDGVGDILVTDLENYAFPFIRYRIGDKGAISNNTCRCGCPFLCFDNIVGRSLDTIKSPSGRIISGELFPHFFKDFPEIILGQVVQDTKNHIEVRLKIDHESKGDFINILKRRLEQVTGPELQISIFTDKAFITNPTGKYRPVISKISNQKQP